MAETTSAFSDARAFHIEPLLGLSALLAIGFGLIGPVMSERHADLSLIAGFKASSIVLLAAIAARSQSRLLALGLALGAAGDIGLAYGAEFFLPGAIAFLIGHLCYIGVFVRAGVGLAALMRSPWRLLAVVLVAAAAFGAVRTLIPHDSPLSAPLLLPAPGGSPWLGRCYSSFPMASSPGTCFTLTPSRALHFGAAWPAG
jgi:hypothetical protein